MWAKGGRQACVRMPREITVMQLTWGWWYWSSETHKHTEWESKHEGVYDPAVTWAPAVFPVFVPWGGIIHLHWESCRFPAEPWNLKHRHLAPLLTPTPQHLYICYGDQYVQPRTVCRAINSALVYLEGRIAGHAACSHLLLWQTFTIIHACKVRRYFNIRWSQLDPVLIFIKAVRTCCSVNNWRAIISQGRRRHHFYTHTR